MTCDEIRELLELYAISSLEPEEHIEISGHLLSGCPVCNRNLRKAIGLNTAVLTLAPDSTASQALRNRVLALVRPQAPRGRSWGWMGLSAALAAGLAWFAVDGRTKLARMGSELANVRRDRDTVAQEAQRLNTAFSFLRDPQTRPASTKPDAAQPRGTYFISPSGVLLIASNLRPLSAGQTYQMWVIPKGQAPRPAGLFRPDNTGSAVHFVSQPVDVANAQAVAISVEPEAGSTAPTTTPLLITPVVGI